jgi:hypothetical protein
MWNTTPDMTRVVAAGFRRGSCGDGAVVCGRLYEEMKKKTEANSVAALLLLLLVSHSTLQHARSTRYTRSTCWLGAVTGFSFYAKKIKEKCCFIYPQHL